MKTTKLFAIATIFANALRHGGRCNQSFSWSFAPLGTTPIWKAGREGAKLLGIILAGTLILCSCDPEPTPTTDPDPAVPQTYTTKGPFGGQREFTITGTFSNADWNGTENKDGIKTQVENALNAAYAATAGGVRADYNDVFLRGVTITVKTFTAPNADKTWETTNDGKTLYVNTTKLDNLQSCLDTIIDKMYDKIATNGYKTTFELTMLGKKITVKDTRTNPSKQLDELGIITRLTNALNENVEIVPNGLVIDVESTTEYPRFRPYSATKMGANFTYVSADDEYFTSRMEGTLSNMADGNFYEPTFEVGEVDGIPVYRVQGVTPEEAEAALAKFELAFAELDTYYQQFLDKVNTVHFVSGSAVTYDKTTKTMKIGIEATADDIANGIWDIVFE